MRLQKAIANAGFSSRREAEELIRLGLVRVNGEAITDPAVDVDVERDSITIGGKRLKKPKTNVYILMNKPVNCMTTTEDDQGRETIMDLLKLRHRRGKLFPVGRLDYKSEGVVILTNDGDLMNRLLHPKFKVPKVYQIKVRGNITDEMLRRIEKGIKLKDGLLSFRNISIIKRTGKNTWLELTITEGRNRILRRAFEHIRYPVLKLKRISFGGLSAKGLKPGEYRFLEGSEVKKLKSYSMAPDEK